MRGSDKHLGGCSLKQSLTRACRTCRPDRPEIPAASRGRAGMDHIGMLQQTRSPGGDCRSRGTGPLHPGQPTKQTRQVPKEENT